MYDLILLGWSTVDVNANLCKSERNFTIDVRAGQVKIDLILIKAIFLVIKSLTYIISC